MLSVTMATAIAFTYRASGYRSIINYGHFKRLNGRSATINILQITGIAWPAPLGYPASPFRSEGGETGNPTMLVISKLSQRFL